MADTVREEVRELLIRRDYVNLVHLCREDRRYWKSVRFAAYDADEAVFWPAIEVIARVMRQHWESGQEETVREYIRSLLWSLNDESGGIGWNAPQTIAEIIVLIPELLDPYAGMMISRTREEPLLLPNALWAVGRLGRLIEKEITFFQESILKALRIDDPRTLGVACWATGETGFVPAAPLIRALTERREDVRLYLEGEFLLRPLGEWAREALDKLPQDKLS